MEKKRIRREKKKTGVQKALGKSQLLLNLKSDSKSDSKYITPVSVCMSIAALRKASQHG